MAAPMVSGAVVLLMEKDPSLTPDQVKARLMRSAFKLGPAQHVVTDASNGTTYNVSHDIFSVGRGT